MPLSGPPGSFPRAWAGCSEGVGPIGGEGYDMTKGLDRGWSATASPLGIGFVEGSGTKNFSDALNGAGIHSICFESAATAQEWPTWHRLFR